MMNEASVDVGSSGWRNFEDFKDRVIDRSRTRVLAMLNIVGKGMGGGEIEQNTDDMDAKATAEMAKPPMMAKRQKRIRLRALTTRSFARPITTIGVSNTKPRIKISRIVRSM